MEDGKALSNEYTSTNNTLNTVNKEFIDSKENIYKKENKKYYLKYSYKYTNIGHAFAGIGYVLVDIDGVIEEVLKKNNLSISLLPTLFLLEYFEFVHNALKGSFQDVRYFYIESESLNNRECGQEENMKFYDFYRKAFQNIFGITLYKNINREERVAFIVTSFGNESIFNSSINNGYYTTCIDSFIFQDDSIYGHIFTPNTSLLENNSLKDVNTVNLFEDFKIIKNTGEKTNSNFRKEILQKYEIKVGENEMIEFKNLDEINKSQHSFSLDGSISFYEDHYLSNRLFTMHKLMQEKKEFALKNDIESVMNGLDLCMPPIPEKVSMKHIQNITKSAKSLCDGNFMFSDALMFAVEDTATAGSISKKSQKIIEQNNKKKEVEKAKADISWLNNFFSNYMKLKTYSEKRKYVEGMKINNEAINRKLLLLKIELYSQIWNIETKSENPDESKLIPLYLSCLEYMNKYNLVQEKESTQKGKNSKSTQSINKDLLYNKEEMDFVAEIFSNAGFECTTKEILKKFNLESENVKGEVKVSDIDLYFQLKYCGQYLKRSLGTKKDNRVPFEPDAWQVQLLDAVDAEKSAIISAPTSSGKTFICYYVVEKLLKNFKKNKNTKTGGISNKTESIKFKEQENVITDETSFSTIFDKLSNLTLTKPTLKSSKLNIVVFCLPTKALANQVSADIYARFKPLKNVNLQGTLMNDRCSEPYNSQVLITIPSMLEMVLLNEVCNISYLVIDEVHKINDPLLCNKLERVIHMAQCPMLLLSATIGNLSEFYAWFKQIESSKGRETELVTHKERFCELRHFAYVFGKENKNNMVKLNCMFAYTQQHLKDFGFGDDLQFLPEELLNIFYYIYMVLTDKKLIKKLAPRKFFKSNIISKHDVKQYEIHLLETFQHWVQKEILTDEQVNEVYKLLTGDAHEIFDKKENLQKTTTDALLDNIYNVCVDLQKDNLLPAIFFITDREMCDKILRRLVKEMSEFDEIVETKKEKNISKEKPVILKKEQWIEDSIQNEQVKQEGKIRHTFCGMENKLSEYEVKQELKDAPAYIVEAALRGVGIHHNEVSRKTKSAMEILFRKKHIKVLIATETLSLGINMPCRTAVFYGDSVDLDPMNYKQMAGRAGRRGYDTLGNVVYCGMTKSRIQNLMVSMLPKLKGGNINTHASYALFGSNKNLLENCLKKRTLGEFIKSKSEEKNILDINSLSENTKSKNEKINSQISSFKFIYKENCYLRDLYFRNREHESSIFIFGYLFDNGMVDYSENAFMLLVSHLFEVIPAIDSDIFLEDLSPSILSAISNLVENTGKNTKKYLQSNVTSSDLSVYSSSVLHLLKCNKNSYIYDFYSHGSKGKINHINKIGTGELWRRLQSIQIFIDSVVDMVERYFTTGDERYKKLKVIQKNFEEKYRAIFA
ncbi:hypothetical protein EHP00_1778 [Ecytonucleospora hepatopenaei]|uniref:Uncharacterized protein n=1 Tax=Ecytonucleospora hepatopenaei TaxID=646526 RepID=A0A1W0E4F5_9MICR|nr:hypothetical protein EHP00_1778 [Ecytonucleospora hepatopenaei]